MTADAPTGQPSDHARPSRSGWLALGGVLAALGASSCCVLPLALFALGVSGAWIGALTALSPYQPIFVGLGLLCVTAGLVAVYRRPKDCGPEHGCATSPPRRLTKAALWAAAALMLAVLLFPFVTPLFLQA